MPVRPLEVESGAESIQAKISIKLIGQAQISHEIQETVTHDTYISEELRGFNPPVLRLEEPTLEDQLSLPKDGKSKIAGTSVFPKLEGFTRADPVLTDRVRRLIRVLWAIVVSRALQVGFPLVRTTVSVFEDPTEQARKPVLRLFCKATAVQAIAFWDSLEPDLQGWLATLSEADRTTFITKISLRVHWR